MKERIDITWRKWNLNVTGLKIASLEWKCVSRSRTETALLTRDGCITTLSRQVTSRARRMNSPAATHAAYRSASSVTARTTVVTGVMKSPVGTAPPSPAARRMSACPEARCATGERTAETAGTSLRNFALLLDRVARCLPLVRLFSSSAETVVASLGPFAVTT